MFLKYSSAQFGWDSERPQYGKCKWQIIGCSTISLPSNSNLSTVVKFLRSPLHEGLVN
jgi:hypothetical protein